MNAVAKPAINLRPRKSRSQYACLFDLTDEREVDMCQCLAMFHRGGRHVAVKFRRVVQEVEGKPHRIITELAERAPRRGTRNQKTRWTVITWDIDQPAVYFRDCPTRKAALVLLGAGQSR